MSTLRRAQVLEAILSAFCHVRYPGDNSIVAGRCCDEEEQIIKDFKGKQWFEITPEIIDYHYDSLPLLSSEAYCYFLPRYLQCSLLKLEEGGDLVLQFTVYSLMNPRIKERFYKRSSLLTEDQQRAIRSYLLFLKEQKQVEHLYADISKALDKYWNHIG